MIGIVGIGLLGGAIAQRLHDGGFELCGWDLNPANLDAAVASGHVRQEELQEIAATCTRIVLCLPNSQVVEAVVGQIAEQLQPGTIVIDTTTGSPTVVTRVADRLAARGVGYMDACVGGSSEEVRRNRAMILCGASQEAFSECRSILEAIVAQVHHLGPAGSGTRMKLVFNLVLGLNRAVLAEALVFAAKSGIAPDAALGVLRQGAAYSRIMDTKGRKMIDEDFAPQARLSQHLKDVRQILEQGQATGAKLPLSERHAQILQEVESAGYGAEDNTAVIRWFKGLL